MSRHKTKHRRERSLTPDQEIALIQKQLGYVTYEREADSFEWTDLGDGDLNEVFGDREQGICWGRMYEVSGWESHGKSLVCTRIGGILQRADPEHTYVIKVDLENSNSEKINRAQGINYEKFYHIKPKLFVDLKEAKKLKALTESKNKKTSKKAKKELKLYMQSAEQLIKECETLVKYLRRKDSQAKIYIMIDSVTGMLVSEEEEAGVDEQNMRTKVSLASFLSVMCRRWVSFVDNYNCIAMFINQLREAPGKMFGDPAYTTGGKALKYYCASRVRVRRVKDGKIKKGDKVIGIRGMITNYKNKMGGAEGHKVGFKCITRKGRWKWASSKAIESDARKAKYGDE